MSDLTPAGIAEGLEEFIHYPKLGYAKAEDIDLFKAAAFYLRQIAEGKCRHKQTTAAPENKPLTLNELREMDGEPVWVEYQSIDGIKHSTYGINWNAMRCVSNGYVNFKHKTYGKAWLAYARKPEGSKP